MKGYKVFKPDWTCQGFQYEVGQTYEMEGDPKCCERGFHFCLRAVDCFDYYRFIPQNKVAEVEALGEIAVDSDGTDSKRCTNKIRIVRELNWHEVLDLVNSGGRCTGFRNSGDQNSGSYNSGYCNSGSFNSGSFNCVNHNSGSSNSGRYNSGSCNSGNFNSGHFNSGHYNTGDFNKASHCAGCFNTENKPLFFFDKPSDWTYEDWYLSEAWYVLGKIHRKIGEWIRFNDMTDEEKKQNPASEITGGYLKACDTSVCFKEWWNGLDNHEKTVIKEIPNFDAEKFFEITGIRVEEEMSNISTSEESKGGKTVNNAGNSSVDELFQDLIKRAYKLLDTPGLTVEQFIGLSGTITGLIMQRQTMASSASAGKMLNTIMGNLYNTDEEG